MNSVLDNLPDGVPCSHSGCLSHLSHPCEGCGRIGGRKKTSVLDRIRSGDLQLCEDMAGFGEELWCQREEETAELLHLASIGTKLEKMFEHGCPWERVTGDPADQNICDTCVFLEICGEVVLLEPPQEDAE